MLSLKEILQFTWECILSLSFGMSLVFVTFPFSAKIVSVTIINNYDFCGYIFCNITNYFPFTSFSCKELWNLLSISQSPSSISSIACPPTVNPGNGKWFQFSLSPIQWRWASKDVEYWYLLMPALHSPILDMEIRGFPNQVGLSLHSAITSKNSAI